MKHASKNISNSYTKSSEANMVCLESGDLYYINSDGIYLYRDDNQKVIDGDFNILRLYGTDLYTIDKANGQCIRINSKRECTIIPIQTRYFDIAKDKIFYLNDDDCNRLYVYDLKSGNTQKIIDNILLSFCMNERYLVFIDFIENELCILDLDTYSIISHENIGEDKITNIWIDPYSNVHFKTLDRQELSDSS